MVAAPHTPQPRFPSPWLLLVVSLCLTLPVLAQLQAEPVGTAQIRRFYEFLRQTDNTIIAANVMTLDTSRLIEEASLSMGTQDFTTNAPNWPSTAVRINTVSEMLVAVCVLELVSSSQLPSLDAAIPTRYLPRGVTFANPAHQTTPLTLRQLLTHTSTLRDDKFSQFQRFTPDTVLDLRSFIEAFFLISSGGTFSVAPDVWMSAQPGAESSYRYARANVALLAFIVEQVIIERPTLVNGPTKNFMAYAQELILAPLGMAGTWVRGLNGDFPTLSYPQGIAIFTNRAVRDISSAGTAQTSTAIHPAYPADFMYLSSAEDLARLVRSLWLNQDGTFRVIGSQMLATPLAVASSESGSSAGTGRRGQVAQAHGAFKFNGALMCSIALASAVITRCPLRESSNVWGHMGVGTHSMVGVFCTDTASTANPTCTSLTISFYDSGSSLKTFDYALGMAAVAFQQAIGDRTESEESVSKGDDTQLYGLWVFFGVVGIVTFVLVASYFTEYLIQPAPLTAGVAMPTAIPGMAGNPVDNYYGGK